MDFFSSQDAAKRNTFKLTLLFVLAVITMVVLTNILVMFALGLVDRNSIDQQGIDWTIFLAVGGGVIALVAMGSLYKMMMLSGGGDRIAEQLNGELVVQDDGSVKKLRLLNIVEEMAIASGVPVPPVYLIPGDAINAFAAGHTPSDAVIGVSKGALDKLTRDELQGVIAHEFSHILNGDMRLNIRLVGVLHGILLIGMVGYYLLRFTPRSRDSKGSGGVLALGIGMIVIGYGGTFFGNLIKAAVNRQREYLADSAAVQFTRNPDGIGGALIRIGAAKNGSVLDTPGSAEISHALFSQGFKSSFTSFFATHPPLENRIQRILPTWNGEFEPLHKEAPTVSKDSGVTSKERLSKAQVGMMAAGAAILGKEKIIEQVGRPTEDHVVHARKFIDDLPGNLKKEVHSPFSAQALIYSLVLDSDEIERKKQLLYLRSTSDQRTCDEVVKQAKAVAVLGKAQRLPLVDLALSALRQLSSTQYQDFRRNLMGLIAADNKVSFFEWIIQKIVIHHLDGVFTNRSGAKLKEPSMRRATEAGTILLSLFSHALKQKGLSQQEVYAIALQEISWIEREPLEHKRVSLDDLDKALDDLSGLKPRFKKTLLQACAAAVMADNYVSADETELLRAVASGLDCPMPPIIVSE